MCVKRIIDFYIAGNDSAVDRLRTPKRKRCGELDSRAISDCSAPREERARHRGNLLILNGFGLLLFAFFFLARSMAISDVKSLLAHRYLWKMRFLLFA
jgi:hypothetical protein